MLAEAGPCMGERAERRRRAGEVCDNRCGPGHPQMLVRPLRPVDVVALASFQRRTADTEITAHAWPRLEPESGRVPYLTLVSSSLGHRPGGQRAWVAEAHGHVAGLAMAHARAGGLVWDVVHLHAAAGEESAAAELLEQVVACAGRYGARRVFLETPMGSRGQ